MKTVQVIGLLLALAVLGLAVLLLRDLGPQASASAATGLGLIGMGLPLLGPSARLLIPSSAALCWPSRRRRCGVRGAWLQLWALNGAQSC